MLPESSVDPASQDIALVSQLESVIRKALGPRVRNLVFINTSSTPFPPANTPTTSDYIDLGVQLDADHTQKLVEHGPPAEDTEGCEKFRQFWGEKAELRRFNDGRIVESVVWELTGKVSNERLQIPGRIVRYIVGRHFKISPEDVTVFDEAYDSLLSKPADVIGRYSPSKPLAPEPAQRAILAAFEDLVKDIKTIEGLPLSLVNAVPVDENLRYTSSFIALPLDKKVYASLPDSLKYIPALDAILLFEKSTRWPDDLEAIQKIKIAFLDAVAQALLAKGAPHAVVAFERHDRTFEDHVSLEVLLLSGYAFRLRIYHDREATLLDRIISDKRSTPEYERKRAQAALDHHRRVFIVSPQHHAAVLSLQRRFPSYSHTVRLVKRWLASHWLAPYISAETTELLCAGVYLNPGVKEAPCSGQSGFARCVALIAEWDFKESPIVVALYTATESPEISSVAAAAPDYKKAVVFPSATLAKAQEEFAGHLAVDPSLSRGAWSIVTENDTSGRYWSRDVTALVANRVKELAKATVVFLRTGAASGALDTKVSSCCRNYRYRQSRPDTIWYARQCFFTQQRTMISSCISTLPSSPDTPRIYMLRR